MDTNRKELIDNLRVAQALLSEIGKDLLDRSIRGEALSPLEDLEYLVFRKQMLILLDDPRI